MPSRYGPWRTVASRFYYWQKARIWDHLLKTLQRQKDTEGEFDWRVRLINRLKQFRRVATRCEKRAENYEAMLTLATIKAWI